jgi:hypothetical protein
MAAVTKFLLDRPILCQRRNRNPSGAEGAASEAASGDCPRRGLRVSVYPARWATLARMFPDAGRCGPGHAPPGRSPDRSRMCRRTALGGSASGRLAGSVQDPVESALPRGARRLRSQLRSHNRQPGNARQPSTAFKLGKRSQPRPQSTHPDVLASAQPSRPFRPRPQRSDLGGHSWFRTSDPSLVRIVTTTPPTCGFSRQRRSESSRGEHSRAPPSSREQSALPFALPPRDSRAVPTWVA